MMTEWQATPSMIQSQKTTNPKDTVKHHKI